MSASAPFLPMTTAPDGTIVHHVGITVSDIDASARFYGRLLGGDLFGPYRRCGPRIDAVTGHRGVVVEQMFVTATNGRTMVELLSYTGGPETVIEPDNSHVGAVHIAVTVDDIDAALNRLRSQGVSALSDPIEASPPLTGCRVVYVLDPDRVRVELVELPR
ncbi:VOC family protein [Rhodococcus sp. P1Y]|nr:VOC family protein [Rhodococcus sp. P1Y]